MVDDVVKVETTEPIAEGVYVAEYTGTQKRENNEGREYYIHRWQLKDGRTIYEVSSTKLSAKSKLGDIARALGFDVVGGREIRLSDFVGKKCQIVVKHEEKNGQIYARITGHLRVDQGQLEAF